jgi:hypothetical protein
MNNFPYYCETFHGSTGNLKGPNISWWYGKLFPYYHETFHGTKMLLGQCRVTPMVLSTWSTSAEILNAPLSDSDHQATLSQKIQ